jgi:hypothetical protein
MNYLPGKPMRHFLPYIIAISMLGCTQLPPTEIPNPVRPQQQAVVFDIDGTLTPQNLFVFEARAGAAQAVRALSGKGYKIVYLSTRIPLFQSGLPDWLHQNGFPQGPLHVAQSAEERAQAEKFKFDILSAYLKQGWKIDYAYGDSSTDFAAYAEAGIPQEHVFALKRWGSDNCQNGVYQRCLDGWIAYLPYIEREITVAK